MRYQPGMLNAGVQGGGLPTVPQELKADSFNIRSMGRLKNCC